MTVWSSGQLLIHFRGTPGPGLVALFAAGAVCGYGLLQLAVRGTDAEIEVQLGASPRPLRAWLAQAVAVAVVLAVAAVAALLLPSLVCWPLAGLATVVGYLGVTAAELALQASELR